MVKYVEVLKETNIIQSMREDTSVPEDTVVSVYYEIPEIPNINLADSYIYIDNIISLAPITDSKKIAIIKSKVSEYLNSKAQEKGYDNIINASLRAALPGSPYYSEGVAYGEWMDNVWAYCYQELDKIQQGLRTEPTIEEFISELPQLSL